MNRKKLVPLVVATIAALAFAPLQADELDLSVDSQTIERGEALMPQSYASMLEKATPSVVSVHTARIVKVARGGRGGLSPEEELLRRFFGMPSPRYQEPQGEPEERRMPQGIGSGVIVSEDGYILTNNHVVSDQRGEDADEILVQLNDGRELNATIVGRDPLTDVAILKVDADDLPAITIADSDNIKVGDVVFAIGNPMEVGLTVTQGIISATNRKIGIYGERGYESFIQTDASINPGNSGGALIDSAGRLIGINSAIISRSGGNIGIGFAIPSNLAVSISQQLADTGEVRRGFLGVSLDDVTPELAEAFGLDTVQGVVVNDVEEDSAAANGGIKQGDIILSLDGKPIESFNQFRIRIGHTAPGTEIEVEVFRDGKRETLNLEVGSASGRFASLANELVTGVEIAKLSDETAERYRIPENIDGVIVLSVDPESNYARTLREGMVIQEVNDQQIETINQAREALRNGVNKLFVYDRGRRGYLPLRIE
ncbi:Do family serine endopeptidase [Pelagicoccus sp. SDUM812003]|uniref:Do family serine endopeptidase n=1 Tax=Pelagicoccus sp. SDUM812003 TaxID=3041267 RepID=UPI0028103562|nr:Do family serine endopeptidase [Pelagicoccus sp. SDUM812003]MDQ8202625.1 Do family serine endopeptidase [Pelagicoccus sp. SDUM812003]